MTNKQLVFIPSGGLANRMRAIASAYQLCSAQGVRLSAIWFADWGARAPFSRLFMPIDDEVVTLRDASVADLLLYDRPRRHNLWLPLLPQKLMFGQRIDEKEVDSLKQQGFDFAQWATRRKRSYMSCYSEFGDVDDTLLRRLFRPVTAITEKIESLLASGRNHHLIGMHIRRTDNIDSIRLSPIELFIRAAQDECQRHPDTQIFLATDDEATKARMRQLFGQRIITQQRPADRDSIEGLQGGLIDMYALARTAVIYGSAGSSFSVMAARLGATRLSILSNE